MCHCWLDVGVSSKKADWQTLIVHNFNSLVLSLASGIFMSAKRIILNVLNMKFQNFNFKLNFLIENSDKLLFSENFIKQVWASSGQPLNSDDSLQPVSRPVPSCFTPVLAIVSDWSMDYRIFFVERFEEKIRFALMGRSRKKSAL